MRILFFDDERWRHDLFDDRNRGKLVHHAYTVKQFKAAIREYQFDLISFDYDIDDAKKETGLDAVNALIDRPRETWPKHIVVHSWNSRGAGELMARLREVGVEAERKQFESETTRLMHEAEQRFAERLEDERNGT